MQRKTLTFLILLFLSGTLLAQEKLNVAGDARIDGVLKLIKGDDNTVIGLNAGTALTTGSDNTFMGEKAGLSTTTGQDNVFLGNDAGRTNVGGSSNVFVGGDAGQDNTTGSHNIYVGNASGQSGSTATNNTFVGDSTGYANTASGNTFIGYKAGLGNSTGDFNLFIGNSAGRLNTTGAVNTFIGNSAGRLNTTGAFNTFIGNSAGRLNTTGAFNTFIGNSAGSNINSSFNTFIGLEAGQLATGGGNNTFIGRQAGRGDLTGVGNSGSNNVFVGQAAGLLNTTGDRNTFVGTSAGDENTTGSDLTAFGYNITANLIGNEAPNNAFALGNQAVITASHSGVLGNISTQKVGGYVNWSTASDGRMKKNIREDVKGLAFVLQLRPVTYQVDVQKFDQHLRPSDKTAGPAKAAEISEEEIAQKRAAAQAYARYLEEKSKIRYTGFIAQEVEKTAEDSDFDFSGVIRPANEHDHYSLRYAEFVVPLVKATQEQQELIDELETEVSEQNQKITQLERDNRQLRDELAEIKALLGRVLETEGQSAADQTIQLGNARLLQNSPNPFSEATYIDYFIPEGTGQAEIRITDMSGRVLKSETIAKGGEGRLQLQAQRLPAGTYAYTLLVDGRVVETKQMVLTK